MNQCITGNNILSEMIEMAIELSQSHKIPPIREFFLPDPYGPGKQGHSGFLVMLLDGGAAGISYLLLSPEYEQKYRRLLSENYTGKFPQDVLSGLRVAGLDPVDFMIALTAVNAICQHVMRENPSILDHATDSLGLMDIRDGDRVGMVGFFPPLMKYLENTRAELVIIEKDESILKSRPDLKITLDPSALRECTKVICTSTTVLNNSLDEVLGHCRSAKHISILGPTAGFYPDALFRRGIDVLGGRYVRDGDMLLSRIKANMKWGDATEKLCFRRDVYRSILTKNK
jgi:uncharacterized protein